MAYIFGAGIRKSATLPLTVAPAGMNCSFELWLSPDGSTKIVTSGMRAFVSTGIVQAFSVTIDLPARAGDYKVLVDVLIEGQMFGGFMDPTHVLIPDVNIGPIVWA